ncbi:hypothetical protein, partial [Actinomadura sp. LOL_011]
MTTSSNGRADADVPSPRAAADELEIDADNDGPSDGGASLIFEFESVRDAVEVLDIAADVFDTAAGQVLRSLAPKGRAIPPTEREQSWLTALREIGGSDDAILAALADVARNLRGMVEARLAQYTDGKTEPGGDAQGQSEDALPLADLPSDSARIRRAIDELGLDARPKAISDWLEERGATVPR